MKHILLTRGRHKQRYPVENLAALCLTLCGGGITTKQTANAMVLGFAVQEKGKVERKGFTIEIVETV